MKKTRASEAKNVIGERVRLARLAMRAPVSQEDLSGRLAARGILITQTGISKLENRERYVMDYEVVAIAKALKVSVSWLFGESKKSAIAANMVIEAEDESDDRLSQLPVRQTET